MGRLWASWVALVTVFVMVACGGTTRNPGSEPNGPAEAGASSTSGVFVDHLRQDVVDKMDLLLVIDNSISMGDKQALLAQALPLLVQRLVSPICVRDCTAADDCTPALERSGIPTGGNADASGQCANGRPELTPLSDLHVGVITSSLGSHGASGPKDVCLSVEDDDHAQLLGALRGLETWSDRGFLAWDPRGRKNPPGDTDAAAFFDKFAAMVQSAGEHGCGYEATLEAWYRFLIDPEPPQRVVVTGSQSEPTGIDQTILEQRASFLRQDSVVVIAMLTDENDCSIIDHGLGFAVATAAPMFRSTSQCQANPNDHCCQSCGDAMANEACPALATDPECQQGATLAPEQDDLNLRCWQQKRRFGIDLLQPISRYVDGLRSSIVTQPSTGESFPNPLFVPPAGRLNVRDSGLVLLAGIVGVPWQDLADEESLTGPGLRYLTASELEANGRWQVVLGDPAASPPVPPIDPLMVETPEDRTTLAGLPQQHPITGDSLIPSGSNDPQANPINGHEQMSFGRDLQYACTFPLAAPRACDQAAFDNDEGCDCFESDLAFNRPLCQPPSGGVPEITQYYAKAYPGLRHLEVLKDLGDSAIVASTCPKVIDEGSPSYGYNPAIDAIIDRVRDAFKPRCFPRPLPFDSDGRVTCTLVEALPTEPSCNCEALNRGSLSADISAAVRAKLETQQLCGVAGSAPCDSICLCELPQLSGAELDTCQNAREPPVVPGYCYLSASSDEANLGNPELVLDCAADQRRLIRFTGGTPTPGAFVLVACGANQAP